MYGLAVYLHQNSHAWSAGCSTLHMLAASSTAARCLSSFLGVQQICLSLCTVALSGTELILPQKLVCHSSGWSRISSKGMPRQNFHIHFGKNSFTNSENNCKIYDSIWYISNKNMTSLQFKDSIPNLYLIIIKRQNFSPWFWFLSP
jgi:hypothetical protein